MAPIMFPGVFSKPILCFCFLCSVICRKIHTVSKNVKTEAVSAKNHFGCRGRRCFSLWLFFKHIFHNFCWTSTARYAANPKKVRWNCRYRFLILEQAHSSINPSHLVGNVWPKFYLLDPKAGTDGATLVRFWKLGPTPTQGSDTACPRGNMLLDGSYPQKPGSSLLTTPNKWKQQLQRCDFSRFRIQWEFHKKQSH